jgi:hypothetical protein
MPTNPTISAVVVSGRRPESPLTRVGKLTAEVAFNEKNQPVL